MTTIKNTKRLPKIEDIKKNEVKNSDLEPIAVFEGNPEEKTIEEVLPKKDIAKNKFESEIDFLNRLLHFQEQGGWGKQLHPMIKQRIALIGN